MPGEQHLLQPDAGNIFIPAVNGVNQRIAVPGQGKLDCNILYMLAHGISFPFRSSSCRARSLLFREVKASRNASQRASRFSFLYSLASRLISLTADL
ncbi:hypothetical protein D3C80_1955650 [compost metagenome]